jgi:hypothetical protein
MFCSVQFQNFGDTKVDFAKSVKEGGGGIVSYSKISRGRTRKVKISVIRWETYRMRGRQLVLLSGLNISMKCTFRL